MKSKFYTSSFLANKKLYWGIGRFLGFLILGFIAGVLGNIFSYQNYWKGTIYSVQTVDFNILSHTLPFKLSTLMINGNKQEIQKTIDSNFALFWIIVTDCKKIEFDCSEQKILYVNKPSYRSERWKDFDVNQLSNQPFDYLKDPPPLFTERNFENFKSTAQLNTSSVNAGINIGRVYYVRRTQPAFVEDYSDWLQKYLFRGRIGSQRSYTYFVVQVGFIILVAIFWVILELTLFLQNKSKQLILNESKLLEAENNLFRISTFNNVFSHLIDTDFTSVTANQVQKLSNAYFAVMSRLKTDTQNIIHDINKAPILSNSECINDIKTNLSDINLDNDLVNSMQNLINTVDDSVNILKISIDNLRNITNIEGELVNVNEQLKVLQNQLHPSAKRWQINFNLFPEDLMISFNPWHFRSIVSNAINNSSASLRSKDLSQDSESSKVEQGNKLFQGTINISSYLEENLVVVEVSDNGIGIPENIIAELYKTDKRLNKSAGDIKGNGSMIVNAYLKLHQANVVVLNNEDSGAIVKFKFSFQQSK